MVALVTGCGPHNLPSEDSSKTSGGVYKLACDSVAPDRQGQTPQINPSVRITIKVNEDSRTASLKMAAGTESVDIAKKIHLLILNGPPDMTPSQEDYIYMGEDDDKNAVNYSLDIRINKNSGRIALKPAPESPTFKGKCIRLS